MGRVPTVGFGIPVYSLLSGRLHLSGVFGQRHRSGEGPLVTQLGDARNMRRDSSLKQESRPSAGSAAPLVAA